MITNQALTDALMAARDAGEAANAGDDGGTCNFDCAKLYLPHARAKTVETCAAYAKLRASKWPDGSWRITLLAATGQGNRRTRVAEAVYKSLKASGLNASMHYQMD